MVNKHSNKQLVQHTLQLATFLLFSGRAWQHLFWDAPFRALLWDQEVVEGLVLFFRGGTWQEYVTSPTSDQFIQNIQMGFGCFYGVMALVTLCIRRLHISHYVWLYLFSSLSLAFLAVLYTMEKFYHLGQFFEYAIQILLPLFFIVVMLQKVKLPNLLLFIKVSIALTFSAHGLYAVGYYPQPGVFVDMFISILHVTEPIAQKMLVVVGVFDFVVSVALFVPWLVKYGLFYTAVWGGLTAIARTWANFYFEFPVEGLNQNLYETFYRMPHMLVPLVALLILLQIKENKQSNIDSKQDEIDSRKQIFKHQKEVKKNAVNGYAEVYER